MDAPSVIVVVVSWNCLDDIPHCLEKLSANTDYARWRIVVIDNASSDGTREWLAAHADGRYELVLADENLGWVGGVNLALRRYQADYYFFLNPDAYVTLGWLPPLVMALERAPRVGFASPKFLYPDGRVHYRGAHVTRTGGLRVFGHGDLSAPTDEQHRATPFAHGQCLVRLAMVREVGYFDEGFGIGYYEEVDYQLRARRQGWTALYVPESVIVHAVARAFRKQPNGFKDELMIRNWLRVVSLHWPAPLLAWRLSVELLRPVRAFRHGDDLKPIFKAWQGWLKTLPEIATRRAAISREGTAVDFSALRGPT